MSLRGAPQLLADLADKVAAAVERRGVEPEAAAQIGIEVGEAMRDDWRGESIYFPKGVAIDIARRDLEMWEKFNGRNHVELAREYGFSVVYFYRRIKTVGAALRAERQGQLFNDT
ncbi:MAG: hypothetical protein FWC58_11515 [Desulfobulbus sp.]|nr:hypothetical protein [Desulfobulbus sp.]